VPLPRSRSFDGRSTISGTYQTFPPFPSFTLQSKVVGDFGTCDDSVCAPREKRVPNALLIVKKSTVLPRFSGVFPKVGTPVKQLISCPSDYRPTEPSPGTAFPALPLALQNSLAWESLAATNPNVPHVSLPSYWAELKDLPSLFRELGDRYLGIKKFLDTKNWAKLSALLGVPKKILQSSSKDYLMWRWAIKPMLSDISALWNFQEAVNKRLKWLTELQTGDRVLKRKASLRNNSVVDAPTTVALKSVGANIQGRRTVSYFEKVWCSVRWKLDSSVDLIPGVGLEFDPLWVKAHQLTFGLTRHDALAALWQIMPWSWFVDWFLHVSTVIDATNNTIPMTWGDICVMRHTGAIATVSVLSSSPDLSWCTPDGVHRQSEDRKQRLLVAPILPFAPSLMPVFTTGQWSILGALSVVRGSHFTRSKVR